jgi:hypothetical protein
MLFAVLLQAFFQFVEGLRTMADPVFRIRCKFGNSPAIFFNKKNRIVTEAFLTGRIEGYLSL